MNDEQAKARLGSFDVLSGLAILAVVGIHTLAPQQAGMPELTRRLVASGARAVQLFLVVSAVLVFRSLSRAELYGHMKRIVSVAGADSR